MTHMAIAWRMQCKHTHSHTQREKLTLLFFLSFVLPLLCTRTHTHKQKTVCAHAQPHTCSFSHAKQSWLAVIHNPWKQICFNVFIVSRGEHTGSQRTRFEWSLKTHRNTRIRRNGNGSASDRRCAVVHSYLVLSDVGVGRRRCGI